MPYLPNEVLLKIFSLLEEDLKHDDTPTGPTSGPRPRPGPGSKTLSRLCLASRRFCWLARPILYHSLPAQDKKPRLLLFRTLSERPYLGLLVKKVTLEGSREREQAVIDAWFALNRHMATPQWFKTPITQALNFLFGWNLSHIHIQHMQHMENHMGNHMENVELCIFLALVPAIENLSMRLPKDPSMLSHIFGGFTNHLTMPFFPGPRMPLFRLRYLHIRSCDAESTLGFQNTMMAIMSPSLREFSGHMVDFKDVAAIAGEPEDPSPLMKLESIDLKHTYIGDDDLSDFMYLCGGGERLHTLSIHWRSKEIESELDIRKIGDALRQYAPNLRVLELDTHDGWEYLNEWYMLGKVGSLKELHHLETLQIDHTWLVGHYVEQQVADEDDMYGPRNEPEDWPLLWDILPVSLKYLHITRHQISDSISVRNELFELFEGDRFPKLQEVRASRHPIEGIWSVRVGPGHRFAVEEQGYIPPERQD